MDERPGASFWMSIARAASLAWLWCGAIFVLYLGCRGSIWLAMEYPVSLKEVL